MVPESQNSLAVHIYVEGRVQGVGYRRFAQREAIKLGLVGWTRNLWDERVEIQAHGPQRQILEFVIALQKGPTFSQVRDLSQKTLDPIPETLRSLTEFHIYPDLEMP